MIAIRARTVALPKPAAEAIEEHRPAGLESTPPGLLIAAEHAQAGVVQTWFVDDSVDLPPGLQRLRPAQVPRRTDLPPSHPLYGKRVLSVVPAGMPDCTVDDDGRLVPVDAAGDPVPPGLDIAESRRP